MRDGNGYLRFPLAARRYIRGLYLRPAGWYSFQFGRASAPTIPHLVHTMRGPTPAPGPRRPIGRSTALPRGGRGRRSRRATSPRSPACCRASWGGRAAGRGCSWRQYRLRSAVRLSIVSVVEHRHPGLAVDRTENLGTTTHAEHTFGKDRPSLRGGVFVEAATTLDGRALGPPAGKNEPARSARGRSGF